MRSNDDAVWASSVLLLGLSLNVCELTYSFALLCKDKLGVDRMPGLIKLAAVKLISLRVGDEP
jgi:hypothetical protein